MAYNEIIRPTGLIGTSLVITDTNTASWTQVASTTDIVIIEDDFLYVNAGGSRLWPWQTDGNGTAASTNITNPVSGHPGIVRIDTGTDTSGEASLLRGTSNGGGQENTFLGDGYQELDFVCNIPTLSTGGEDYSIYFGLADGLSNFATHPGPNCVIFQYQRSTSVNWQGITKSGGTSTTASGGSNVAVATGWNNFRMTINAAATSCSFFVNGTLIGTSTTNIPTANQISLGFSIKKSAGTTARTFDIDYVRWFHKLTTPRF